MKINETKDGAIVSTPFYTVKLLQRGGRIVSLIRAGGEELVYYPGPIHVNWPGGIAKEVECGYPGEMARDPFRQEILPSADGAVRIRYTYHGKPGFFVGWAMSLVKTYCFRAECPLIEVEYTLRNVGAPELFAEFRVHNDVSAENGSVVIVPTTQGLSVSPASAAASQVVADFTDALAGAWNRRTGEALLFLPDYDAVSKFLLSPGKGVATVEWYYREFTIGDGAAWTTRCRILPAALTSLEELPATLAAVGVPMVLGRERRPQSAGEARKCPDKPPRSSVAAADFSRTVTANLARELAFLPPKIVKGRALPGGLLCSRAIHTLPGCGLEVTLPSVRSETGLECGGLTPLLPPARLDAPCQADDIVLTAEAWWKDEGPGGAEAYIGCCDPEGNLLGVSALARLSFWNPSANLTLTAGAWAGKNVRVFLYGRDVLWTSVRLTVPGGTNRELFASLRVQTPGSDEPMETDAKGKVPLDFVVTSFGAVPRVEYTLGKGDTARTARRLQKTDNAACSSVAGALCAPQAQGTTCPDKWFSARIMAPANARIAYRVVAGSDSVEGTVCRPGYPAAQGLPKGAVHLYVSPAGDDAFTGQLPSPDAKRTDGPFATLHRAQRAVRKLAGNGKPAAPVVVIIRAGTYELDKPLVFGPRDSGSAECPILWTAAPGETVVVSGGRKVAGPWQSGGDGVLTCRLAGRDKGAPPIRQFFVNGKRAPRARVPREGFFHMGAFADDSYRRVFYTPEDLRGVRGLTHAELLLYFVWNEGRRRLTRLDEKKGILTLDALVYAPLTPDRYAVENTPDGLAAAGTWCFDPTRAELSWHPEAGVQPEAVDVTVPVLRELVRFQGGKRRPVRHIALRGLTLAYADWFELDSGKQSAVRIGSAVSLEHAESCCLRNNRIVNVGTYGIGLYQGCRANLVVGNEIVGAGAGGVRIGGEEPDETTGKNAVIDNDIHDCGGVYPSAIGVWIGQSSDNLLLRNHIHDLPYTGISVGWTWGPGPNTHKGNRIEGNTVERVMRLLHDGGAIYLLGISYGTTIRNNTIRDVEGGSGIYLDEGSTGMRVDGNIICRSFAGFALHGTRDNLLERNTIADIRACVMSLSNCQSYMADNRFRGNIFYSTSDAPLIWAVGWTRRFVVDSGENGFFHASGKPLRIEGVAEIATLEDWIAAGYETNPLTEIPRFADAANGDYRILPEQGTR